MLPKKEYQRRISRLRSALRSLSQKSVAVISSAPFSIRNRDVQYPFRQESNFLYLCGSELEEATFLIFADDTKPVLLAPPVSPLKTLWEGQSESGSTVARRLGATLKETENQNEELRRLVRGYELLCFGNRPGTPSFQLASELIATASHRAQDLPQTFVTLDSVIEALRVKKSPAERSLIKEALKISEESLLEIIPMIRPGAKELEIAAALEARIKSRGASLAFASIVAAGPSAATLHYSAHSRTLRKDELLLIDFGAEVNGYAADVTRVFPVSGKFNGKLKTLYQGVLTAQYAAIDTVKARRKIADVCEAAASVITDTLVELKLLKGRKSSLIRKKEYARYFPHSIGHSLGLDVHDIGNLRASSEARIDSGMVLTIEPGIYLPEPKAGLPACGIRIEDDILVTNKGATVLSSSFPKEIDEIEALMQG